jgi:hypothetical protein
VKYIDVRLRIPLAKLGQLIEALPDWAPMIGYDKLEPVEGKTVRTRAANGEYKPGKDTAVDRILKFMTKSGRRLRHSEICAEAVRRGMKDRAANSAVYALTARKLLRKYEDGTYGVPPK